MLIIIIKPTFPFVITTHFTKIPMVICFHLKIEHFCFYYSFIVYILCNLLYIGDKCIIKKFLKQNVNNIL